MNSIKRLPINLTEIKESLVIVKMRARKGTHLSTPTLLNKFLQEELPYNIKESINKIVRFDLRADNIGVVKEINRIFPFLSYQLEVISQYSIRRQQLKKNRELSLKK